MKLLEEAQSKGAGSVEAAEALHVTRQLWCMLIDDLSKKENHLPPELRASLISIGIWIIKECEAIRQGDNENFQGIMDVTRMIKEGLS
jgi:flagellar protein FlaF